MIPSEAVIRSFLPNPVRKSGNHLICTCWSCQKQDHYYYNINTGLSDCKKCQVATNIFGFLKGWGQIHLLEGNVIQYDEQIKKLERPIESESLDLTIPDFKLPTGFIKLDWGSKNIYTEYLKSRKYTRSDFEFYSPGITSLIDRYEDYVIIPITRDYQVKGFVGRYIGKDETKLRYENSRRTKFTKLLDGYDQINNKTHSVIIVEGHFDKISVNYELELEETEEWKTIGTFGKKISAYQLALLKQTNVQDLYFLYDFKDAVVDIKKFGVEANRQFRVFGCYVDTTKDPGDMNRIEILQALNSAKPISQYIYTTVQTGRLK